MSTKSISIITLSLYSKYEYQKLENQTKQTFQVKIKLYKLQITVHEGKGLKGNNISPFCRLTFNKETKVTEVKKQTNSPFWDKVNSLQAKLFVFDVTGEYSDVAKYILFIKVVSENGPFRRNTILGIYKVRYFINRSILTPYLTIVIINFSKNGLDYIPRWTKLRKTSHNYVDFYCFLYRLLQQGI